MRIALNWLKKYVKVPELVPDEELIRLIGARLVEVEGVIDETHKYDNIYVVRVESCEKIPDTHLTLCQVDAGRDELIQVVCGAPNVRAGMLAVWIAPGAVVPASVHEDAPFVIGKRKMRGYESCGMLAGADELDFDDKHEKIAEIDPEQAKPGDALADVFELNDLILEIENKSLTHRPDCFGVIGFAREVAGILGQKFEPAFSSAGLEFLSTSYAGTLAEPYLRDGPVWSGRNIRVKNSNQNFMLQEKQVSNLTVNISSLDICQRYTAVVMEKHGEMKDKYLTWVDAILSKSGMKPINPIVDVTNYLMLLTGQPLHAFDYDKFVAIGGGEKPEINVRLAREGEKLVLLDDKEIELDENDIVICSGAVPVALAGAMGGKSTEVDEGTRNVMIESATFSLYNLRKTQMNHGIFTEAITRFTKGQPAYQTLEVAEACAEMLKDGFEVVMEADEYPHPDGEIVVKITTDEINRLLGTNYDVKTIVRTLGNVDFKVVSVDGDLTIEVPKWRTDIHIKEDIIEEVGRLLGYDNIKPTLPLHATAEKNLMWGLKKTIRNDLATFGANEVLTYSFVSEKLLEKVGQEKQNAYKIVNSISPELQYVRQSLVPSLLEKAYINQKLPIDKFAIFEMNKVYRKDLGVDAEGVPIEGMRLGLVIAERKNNGVAYYQAKKYVEELLGRLGIDVRFEKLVQKDADARPFEQKRAAEIIALNGEKLGVVGEFKNSVRQEFKLAQYLAGFELDLDEVLLLLRERQKKQIFVGKKEKRDLTVVTKKTYAEVEAAIGRVLGENDAAAEIVPITIYQPEGAEEKRISVHLDFTKFNEKAMAELEKL